MELIDILQSGTHVEGLSTAELLEQLGQPDTSFYRQKLLVKLRSEIKADRVECQPAMRLRIDGRPMKVPVYRVKA